MAKAKRPKWNQYRPGDLFALPLGEGGGYGVGLVARKAKSDRIGSATVFCYGFDLVFDRLPSLEEVRHLRVTDAIHVSTCLDRSLADGRWTILGPLAGFRPEDWPVPPHTHLLLKGDVRPTEMKRQRLIITEDVELNSVNIPNTDLIPAEEYQFLPVGRGAGGAFVMELELERAIRLRDPRQYIRITPEVLRVWGACIERVKAAGLYPEAISEAEILKAEKAANRFPIEMQVCIKLGDDHFGTDTDLAWLGELDRRLEEALEADDQGELEGAEIGGGYRRFVLRGRKAETLEAIVRGQLNGRALRPGSHLLVGRFSAERRRRIEL